MVLGELALKKKIRHISVDGNKYNWRGTSLNERNVFLRIWVDGSKRIPWVEARFPFRDPWLNLADLVSENDGGYDASEDNLFDGVTPQKVRCIIEAVIRDKGFPEDINKTINLDWSTTSLQASYNEH